MHWKCYLYLLLCILAIAFYLDLWWNRMHCRSLAMYESIFSSNFLCSSKKARFAWKSVFDANRTILAFRLVCNISYEHCCHHLISPAKKQYGVCTYYQHSDKEIFLFDKCVSSHIIYGCCGYICELYRFLFWNANNTLILRLFNDAVCTHEHTNRRTCSSSEINASNKASNIILQWKNGINEVNHSCWFVSIDTRIFIAQRWMNKLLSIEIFYTLSNVIRLEKFKWCVAKQRLCTR